MAERKHISLIYQYEANWVGGIYYILNIIRALNKLKDENKPFLIIYYSLESSLNVLIAISYPYIEYIKFSMKLNLLEKILSKTSHRFLKREIFLKKLPKKKVKNFYFKTFSIDSSNIEKYFFWITDFQDLHLPDFFKAYELNKRKEIYTRIVVEKQPVVFSSQSALNDFNKFFPNNQNIKKVLPFVSSANSDFKKLSIEELRHKFKITNKYFIVSNQFWAHKNHQIVLKAFALYLQYNHDIELLFTGKEYDHRNPDYTNELKTYVENNFLSGSVKFLGFIDRDEQLKLMSESVAIIQPSLFEGWSTVVEDAKFLNKTIICSDIPVHREQLPESALFFNPYNEKELFEKLKFVSSDGYCDHLNYSYDAEILKFAENFISLFE